MIYRNITPWLCIDEILNISYSTHTDTRMVYYFFIRMNISSYVTVRDWYYCIQNSNNLEQKSKHMCIFYQTISHSFTSTF